MHTTLSAALGPGVDSACKGNKYHESSWETNDFRNVQLTSSPSVLTV
jgi:hypothetical protein